MIEVSAIEKNADNPKSAAKIRPCSLNTLKTWESFGHELFNCNILCPITPYPAFTVLSTANTLWHPATNTTQTKAPKTIPRFIKILTFSRLESKTSFLSRPSSLLALLNGFASVLMLKLFLGNLELEILGYWLPLGESLTGKLELRYCGTKNEVFKPELNVGRFKIDDSRAKSIKK